MDLLHLIQHTENTLTDTFSQVDPWFDQPAEVLGFQPPQGWSTGQVLEHIAVTNRFLLILIDKAASKALKNVNGLDLEVLKQNPQFNLQGLEEVGTRGAFDWIRPEHMEPTGQVPLTEVRTTLKRQLEHCLHQLETLSGGEGLLYSTTMTVNGLGRLNVYEYLCFLAMHARRHLRQMEHNLSLYQQDQGI